MKCKNKYIKVKGIVTDYAANTKIFKEIYCIVTNDEIGKTVSVIDGDKQIQIPFAPLEKFLK